MLRHAVPASAPANTAASALAAAPPFAVMKGALNEANPVVS